MDGRLGRGVCITDASIWTFDGKGRYRRAPRHRTEHLVVPVGWVEHRSARFERIGDDWHVRVVPADRPVGAHGIRTGAIVWTNLLPEDAAVFGPATEWFERSPVPSDRDLWPGELPFTAFGQFGPDALDLRVFDQDVYWVDRTGHGHRIAAMDDAYVTNVLAMLVDRAEEFHGATMLRSAFEMVGDTVLGRANGDLIVDGLDLGALDQVDATAWLRSTPLFRGLARRLADGDR